MTHWVTFHSRTGKGRKTISSSLLKASSSDAAGIQLAKSISSEELIELDAPKRRTD